MTDIINALAGIVDGDALDELRDHRAQAKANAQLSFEALLEPEDPGEFSYRDRYAVAAFTAGLLGSTTAEVFYRDLLRDEDESASFVIADLLDEALARFGDDALSSRGFSGPYGHYEAADLATETTPGPWFTVDKKSLDILGPVTAAGLEFAHLLTLHPRDSRPEHLAALIAAGWDEDGIVSLAGLVSFLNFQIRVSSGLAALTEGEGGAETGGSGAGTAGSSSGGDGASATEPPAGLQTALKAVGERVRNYPKLTRPQAYQQSGLGWVPWIAPIEQNELSDDARAALIEPERAKNPYFRLLARDPAALRARTLTDFDIFFNTSDGLGRAERELAATAASRLNGCLFCASVHSARASEESGERDLVQRLLDEGVGIDVANVAAPGGSKLGNPLWDAIVDASVALTLTPQSFGPAHVEALRAAGLDNGDIVDALNCAAFFNWANRLMLSLGEPEVLAPGR